MIQAVIIKAVLKLLKKQFKLEKILKYVEEPNELDNKYDNLNIRTVNNEKDIEELKSIAHEPREFISCKKCGEKVKEDNKEKKWYDKE